MVSPVLARELRERGPEIGLKLGLLLAKLIGLGLPAIKQKF